MLFSNEFHTRLYAWYQAFGRHELPWRNTDDAYKIYISEVMLQQTQVETVLRRFYFPFLQQFPTLSALAAAEKQEVLKAWEGLGYYTRAANLHKAAQLSAPALPETVEGLTSLPGIGQNTAHAVAAFAYRLPVAVMEANVRRVLHRIFALFEASERILNQKAALLLDTANPFDYNQAMMDLGALVCTKTRPACNLCPANSICQGKDSPQLYPVPKPAGKAPVRRKRIGVLRNEQGCIYATPRTSRFLHGLYHFVEVDAKESGFIWQGKEFLFTQARQLGAVTQTYSHFTLEAEVYLFEITPRGRAKNWHTRDAIQKLPWSKAELKILRLIEWPTGTPPPVA